MERLRAVAGREQYGVNRSCAFERSFTGNLAFGYGRRSFGSVDLSADEKC